MLAAATRAAAGSSVDPSVGLVLSGGGAKGIAHIGVIQALEDNDIPIDYVTGTSMGAIVGGLYAAGYTPQKMLDLILSTPFSYWSTGRIDPSLTYYFNRERPTPTMFSMALPKSSPATDSVPQSLISGIPMSFAFMDMFAAYTAQCGGDFDRLFVPYRSVASNVAGKHKHVFRGGRLSDAIRCSMSFPIVFQPIAVNDTLLYDGGIYDNFPVDVMREDFSPDIMIGVNVSSSEPKGPKTSLMDQLDALITQGHICELTPEEGIYMRINLDQFSLLDFPRAQEIYDIGYKHAMTMIDSIKTRIPSRTTKEVRGHRRQVFKAATPYTRFERVNVTGATPRQNEYIGYLFKPKADIDTIGVERARRAFYRALSTDKFADLFPSATYNDSTGLFALNLKAAVKGPFRGAVGGYITSSTNSFLYASLGYSSLSFRSLDASLEGWIGQTTMAGVLKSRLFLHTLVSSSVGIEAAASRRRFYENEQIFFSNKYPTFLINHEFYGRLTFDMAAGSSGAFGLNVGYGLLRDSYYADNTTESYESGRLRTQQNLWQAALRYSSSTLDEVSYPRKGHMTSIVGMGILGRAHTPLAAGVEERQSVKWASFEMHYKNFPKLSSHFTLGFEGHALLSTRKLLPTYAASISAADVFCPTPSSNNSFRANFRANSYLAAGLTPIYNINSNLSARVGVYGFVPLRSIERAADDAARWGRWLRDPQAFCEAALAYHFPFGTLAGYVNYSTISGSRWNVGLSFGVFVLPPSFLH